MLIAIMVLSVAVVGLMSAATLVRMTAGQKDRENARLFSLRALEWAEAVPLSEDFGARFTDAFGSEPTFGDLRLTLTRDPNSATDPSVRSADVTATVVKLSDGGAVMATMKREVSANGWQNVGAKP